MPCVGEREYTATSDRRHEEARIKYQCDAMNDQKCQKFRLARAMRGEITSPLDDL
ncbi:MAG: hypothetical protein HC845_14110 [Akkermansiaceae bacterium]|nr:hypothetical protein [Akkermansiaceae bacterium]